jgi:ABC-2 type transport system ATP-binding protein
MSETVIRANGLSKWYGPVLGVSDISWTVKGGVIGLLGPNGAGKSTLIKMIAGLLRPSRGTLEVFGADPTLSPTTRLRVGYCPEHEKTYDRLTATEFVTFMAEMSGMARGAREAATKALDTMGLTKASNRWIKGFSKGMRQRTKLAATFVHDPDLLLLDEPLTGVDPVARADIIKRIRGLATDGKTVIVSSHVLHEIEALTDEIIVIYRGQVLAEGNIYRIRDLIDKHPHRIRIECDRPRELARELSAAEHVHSLGFERDTVIVETREPDRCYDLIADTALDQEITIRTLSSPDNNLSSVFDYLTGGSGR